ncbi:MAG TPA: protoglobin domain-containing protein [Xanthobacteraceae bacterium]
MGKVESRMRDAAIAGYDYGNVPRSPVSLDELNALEATVGFTEQDRTCLRRAGELIGEDDAEALVDGWRKIIGSKPHLARWFFGPDQKPDEAYKAAVKQRFVRWVIDLLNRPFDQAWLDYQWEIGFRHTPAKKNLTDGAHTPPQVPLRYLIAFTVPVLEAMRPCLQAKGLDAAEIGRLQAAWTKAVILSLALWSGPYTRADLW